MCLVIYMYLFILVRLWNKQLFAYINHARIHSWNQPVLGKYQIARVHQEQHEQIWKYVEVVKQIWLRHTSSINQLKMNYFENLFI